MNIIKAYATRNDCYKAATPMTPKGIVVHSTGANNPYLKRYVDAPDEVGVNTNGNHWNRPSSESGREVCVHAFIGYDKNNKVRVAQILPYNYACWGVGGGRNGSFNYNPVGHIQFEMCEDGLTNKTYCKQVYDVAVEYSAYLCETFNLNPLGKNVIVSHKEAHALGYGSNHGDPDNWWSKHGYTMDGFRKAVKAKMDANKKAESNSSTSTTKPATKPVTSPVTKPATSTTTSKTIYKVQVGAYKLKLNANNAAKKIKKKGFDAVVTKVGNYYKVQIGAYSKKANAEAMVKKLKEAGFDARVTSNAKTSTATKTVTFKVGDKVKLTKNAPIYGTKETFSSWVYNSTLYVREIDGSRIVISTQKTGAITGAVDKKYLTKK